MKRSPRLWGDGIEALEIRQMMAVGVRSIDGTGNNLLNPLWGSAGVQLFREAAAAYADSVDDPAGADRPSARELSNEIVAQQTEERETDDRFMAAMMYAWGQFIDHDLDLTTSGGTGFNINVPADASDPFSSAASPAGPGIIPFTRSNFDLTTGTSTDNPREQTNFITAWLDASMIYGSDSVVATKLRKLVGGLLKTSPGNDGVIGTRDDMLPFNNATYFPTGTLSMDNNGPTPSSQLFAAGDIRANENIELTSLHTLFVREHNRLAKQIARINSRLGDEQIYQQARAMVIGELQAITYNQWLPTLLGRGALDAYRGYKASVNPGIATEFSTALFRVGHSMLGEDIEFLDNNGEETADEVELNEAFFNPALLSANGVGPTLKYLSSDPSSQIDITIVDAVRNFLFGPPGAGGLDLASLNIQRGRDHGLADYNTTRVAYGLSRVNSFSELTSDTEVAAKLEALYDDVDNVDLWVGALAEDHVDGASVGELMRVGIADQFERIRDGDRFWYQRNFSGSQLFSLSNVDLADVIARNTEINNLQENVFVFHVSVSGTVFNDRNGDRRQNFNERGLSGWSVELLDETGAVVDAVMTSNGRYLFDAMELGTYTINVVEPGGWQQTTRDRGEMQITRGGQIRGIDYGYKLGSTTTTTSEPAQSTLAVSQPTSVQRPHVLDFSDSFERRPDENMMEAIV